MKKIVSLIFTMMGLLTAQNQLYIPEAISGNQFDLTLQNGTTQLFDGMATETMGANGSNFAPTLIFEQGEFVNINVTNNLDEETTIHWHGMHVSPENDGGPHSVIMPSETWNPHFTVMDKACTMWYHPHLHGHTNEHVTKGITGFIIIKDDEEAALNLPRTYGVDDILLNLQTKQFDNSNQIVIGEHIDNVPMVNSTIDAFVELPAQVIRLRLLNGSSMRVFNMGFSNNATFYQIGSDGGLLSAPVSMTRLLLAPAERAEILVDLTGMNGQNIEFKSYGATLPQSVYGIGDLASMMGGSPPGYNSNTLNGSNFTMLQINVGPQSNNNPVISIPNTLVMVTPINESEATVTRSLSIQAPDMMNDGITGPFEFNGQSFNMNVVNQTVQLGDTEIWEIFNMSMVAHPFHIHDVQFYILDRDGNIPPENERGRKDVVLVKQMETVRFIAKFEDFANEEVPYMYHCHMLQHEDEGLMGQFIVEGEEVQCAAGDLNNDGVVNILDIVTEVNIILGIVTPTESQLCAGDINGDGVINILDIVQIVNTILGNRSELSTASANKNGDTLKLEGSIGGIQFNGELLTSVIGDDIIKTENGITLIYNLSSLLETNSFNLSEFSDNIIISSSVGEEIEINQVNDYLLMSSYPNPFNPTTTINFAIPSDSQVSIAVYNLQGREVATLAKGSYDAGNHQVIWNADSHSSGVYFAKMVSGSYVNTQKLMLVK